jgi:hypothetical protein
MVVSLDLPLQIYHALLGRCVLSSRVYTVLKNSVFIDEQSQIGKRKVVHINCSAKDARLLATHAKKFFPAASPYLKKRISLSNRKTPGHDLRKSD